MNRIIITGSKGQLGKELFKIHKEIPDAEFLFYDIDQYDLTDPDHVLEMLRLNKPSFLVNCAAYTAVDKAEEEPATAFAVNAEAVRNIVNASKKLNNLRFIHISTDFVFDGNNNKPYTEDIAPGALSTYGRSKQKGEEYALSYKHSLIIRTSWLYSEYGANFVKTILRLADERDSINVVNDQTGTPTWAADLASAIMNILKQSVCDINNFAPGIYHYSNEGQCNWYDFAREIKRIKGLDLEINPVSTREYPLPAKRPSFSVMNLEKIKKTFGIKIPSWQESLEQLLKRI